MFDDGGYTCFSCDNKDIPKDFHQTKENPNWDEARVITLKSKEEDPEETRSIWKQSRTEVFTDRGISLQAVKRFRARLLRDALGKPRAYVFPYSNPDGVFNSFKMKFTPKSTSKAPYCWRGEGKKEDYLFGMSLFPSGGKYLTITEGEPDAMAAWEMLKTATVPDPAVVSLRDGSGSVKRAMANQKVFEYVNSFEKVILCFDNDKPGRAAVEAMVDLLDIAKVRVVKLNNLVGKDANDYLKSNEAVTFRKAWWAAEMFKPRSILTFAEAWAQAEAQKDKQSYPYPNSWTKLNKMTYGMRTGELVTITAQTGVGKTQIFREVAKHLHDTTDERIAFLSLEETPASSAKGIVSTFVNAPIHLPDCIVDEQEVAEVVEMISNGNRLFYYDDFGSNEIDNVMAKVQFFVKSLGCKFVFLDHFSMIVSDQRHSDERKALDEIATKLKAKTVEWDFNLHAIAHLNRQDEIRGTANIEKLSNIVIKLERDLENPNPIIRNTTRTLVQKNRFSGQTGPGDLLYYDLNTTRQSPINEEEFNNEV